jgi:hypothetical protein
MLFWLHLAPPPLQLGLIGTKSRRPMTGFGRYATILLSCNATKLEYPLHLGYHRNTGYAVHKNTPEVENGIPLRN